MNTYRLIDSITRGAKTRPEARGVSSGPALALVALGLFSATAGAQVVVTTTADLPAAAADCATPGSTTCSLRAALVPIFGIRTVSFNIPGPGPHVIRLNPALGPLVVGSIEVNGLSQPGAGRRPGSDLTNPVDYDLRIGISGPADGAFPGPLMTLGPHSEAVIRGLAFVDHEGVAVRLNNGGLETCFFNTLDGTTPFGRRIATGVEYAGGSGSVVYSSLFLGPRVGVEVIDTRAPTNSRFSRAVIQHNYFGTDRTGLRYQPVEYGVLARVLNPPPPNPFVPTALYPTSVWVLGNLFVGAEINAIRLRGVNPYITDSLTAVRIGYYANDVPVPGVPPATQGAGILIEGPTYLPGSIGGVRITGQRGGGIRLDDSTGPVRQIRLLGSGLTSDVLYANWGLGISLNPAAPTEPTPNDVGDADDGANGLQNYPVLDSIQRVLEEDGINERIEVGLAFDGKPNRYYAISLFANAQCHASGHGEGERWIGALDITTDALGRFSQAVAIEGFGGEYLVPILQEHPFVTAIAVDRSYDGDVGPTEDTDNTSEFSACLDSRPLPAPGQRFQLSESRYQGREGESVLVTVRRTGDVAGAATVRLQTSNGSAVAGRDYTSFDEVLEFETGRRELNVPIALRAQDNEPQPLRDFFVTLLSPTGGPVLDPDQFVARVVVLDDDIRFSVTDTVGNEFDGVMDFGAVEYGDFVEGTVTIRNTGEPTVYFDSIEFIRAPADDRFREVGRTCGRFLDPGESCTITVRFEPGDLPDARRVVANGQLSITPDAGPAVAVSIVGEAPPRANLDVSIEGTPVNPDPSGVVAFTVTAGNAGPADAADGVVRFTVAAGLLLNAGSLSPSAGSLAVDASTVTWTLGPMASGQRETLSYDATVDPATPRGTEITSTASIELVDPRRIDSGDNTSSFTVAVGSAAADLRIVPGSASFWSINPPTFETFRSTTIPIQQVCRTEFVRCDFPERDKRWFRVTLSNLGPDAPEGPVLLRLTTGGLCFRTIYVAESPVLHRPTCEHGEIVEYKIDPDKLQPGASLLIDYEVKAVSGPTGLTVVGVEIVHGTFDPNSGNNFETTTPIQVVIPVPLGRWDLTPCFIATAAYGSWLDPHVVTLRSFRDRWLLTHAPGRLFVGWYYRVSPPLADWIAEREWARGATRGLLAPIVLTIAHPAPAGGLLLLLLAVVPIGRRVWSSTSSSRP